MTGIQQELIEAVKRNSVEKVYLSIDEIKGRYAALYVLLLIKYTKWDIDKFINLLSSQDENEKDFIKTLKLKAFL